MTRMYHRSQVSMEVTKVTLDAGEEDQILIQFWQGSNNYHTVYLDRKSTRLNSSH